MHIISESVLMLLTKN